MAVQAVHLEADAFLVCLNHALSTEKEEVMGLCIGEVPPAEGRLRGGAGGGAAYAGCGLRGTVERRGSGCDRRHRAWNDPRNPLIRGPGSRQCVGQLLGESKLRVRKASHPHYRGATPVPCDAPSSRPGPAGCCFCSGGVTDFPSVSLG